MNNTMIDINLIKKLKKFIKNEKSLKYLDPTIFEKIDEYKDKSNISFNDYYIDYINNLPKLDFDNVVKIAREVYKLYGKEDEFDLVLKKLINNYNIATGSLNKDDENSIINATESRILLSGTFYDVILLCHEIGHKLRCNNSINKKDIMDDFLYETPSIILELAANNYLKDKYGIDINADELRKVHISSIKREQNIESFIFLSVINLLKSKKLNGINLYMILINNPKVIEYLNLNNLSIEDCVQESMASYSYDIGYILGNNIINNKVKTLNTLLNYKDNGLYMPFTINEEIIKETLGSQGYTK